METLWLATSEKGMCPALCGQTPVDSFLESARSSDGEFLGLGD